MTLGFFFLLHWFLMSVDSSPFLSVTTLVGERAVLPCSWKSRLGAVPPSSRHVQWRTLEAQPVYEQWGARRWQAQEYEGRAEVGEEQLGGGDCSLVIRDVQIGDRGRYESYMVLDGQMSRRRPVFIQAVKLSVLDHKSHQNRRPGEDLVIDLHTPHSVRVVFQSRNSLEWTDVWVRGGEDTLRLTLRDLKPSDQGTYKVLDQQGLAVSTVQLTVGGSGFLQLKSQAGERIFSGCAFLGLLAHLLI